MQALLGGDGGRLVIGATGAAASETAPRAVLAMAERMPQMRIGLMEGTLDVLLDLLSQGDLDIVISRSTVERIDEANIRSEERRVGKECVSTCRYRWSPRP